MLQFLWLEKFREMFSVWWKLDELQCENGSNDHTHENFAHAFRPQKRARVSSNNELFIFYSNNLSFGSVFCMKTVESWIQKIFKGKKMVGDRFHNSKWGIKNRLSLRNDDTQ